MPATADRSVEPIDATSLPERMTIVIVRAKPLPRLENR